MSRTQLISAQQPQLFIDRVISSGKFNVILANTPTNNQYIIKAFQKDERSHCAFVKEKRVHSTLNHQNVIQYIPDYRFQVDITHFTVIFMEYAPYGDFFNLILDYAFTDEKLIRTYFHQLIEALKYLHSKGIAHLDLKLENLLLGQDLLLKVADFDLSQNLSDERITSSGTANYRAPEIMAGTCKNFRAADIYSAGVCLYTLMTGAFPFMEQEQRKKIQLFRYDTYVENNEEFWRENEALLAGRVNFSQSFKDLINNMLTLNPSERFSIEQIEESRWYQEPIYTEEELKTEIRKVLNL